jgi:hypothetical protein
MLILRPAHRKPLATVILLHGKKRRARCSTGLNNVLLPTLFTLVDNIEQCCWAWIGCNNIVQHCQKQYCSTLLTMWAAKHCSILFSSVLQQPERFLPCKEIRWHHTKSFSLSLTITMTETSCCHTKDQKSLMVFDNGCCVAMKLSTPWWS